MRDSTARVGLVGLGEAGNLGDDLILVATVDAVHAAIPNAEIAFLSSGQELDWENLAKARRYPAVPTRIRKRFEIPLLRQNARIYRDRDVIVFGGGGLLQTSHHADRPYGWLSYLPQSGARSPRILATGLGLGPLSKTWVRRLRRMKTPFDLAWLRDSDSIALCENQLGWPAGQCRDFIDRRFLATMTDAGRAENKVAKRLGIALRAWPGFTAGAAATHIASIADRHGCEEAVFFVLESNKGRGVDVDFSTEVAGRLRLPTRVRAYQAKEIMDFLSHMATVELAVSMKLHSGAIWGSLGAPTYPIFYAPKVAALFGAEYRGFEMPDVIMPVAAEVEGIPRACDTITAGLRLLLERDNATGSRLRLAASYFYQTKSLIEAVGRRSALHQRRKRVVG